MLASLTLGVARVELDVLGVLSWCQILSWLYMHYMFVHITVLRDRYHYNLHLKRIMLGKLCNLLSHTGSKYLMGA